MIVPLATIWVRNKMEFKVHPAKPLNQSDSKEILLISASRRRESLLPIRTVNLEKEDGRFILEKLARKTTQWLSPKFSHGSKQRNLMRSVVGAMPERFRNIVISSLAPNFQNSSSPISRRLYSMDQGFGLPTSLNPLVSIILPVHNHWWITYRCLRALQANSDKTPYEIILVDDASTDKTHDALTNIRGVTVLQNMKNIGYLLSTNLGASQATKTSKYLILLNNDTEPIDGWLDSLYHSIEKDEAIAIVGSALIYPDGTLQEAGAQIFSGGNGWNLGRGGNPLSDIFSFTREVDYCSAASIIVRKSFWNQVSGFDTRYVPAYCEDSDLALSAWNLGYKVMYEPTSWVIHHEGVSHGKNTNSGLKKYQRENTRKLFAKWEPDLREHWEDLGVPRFEASRDSIGIVVVCDRQLPAKARDAGSIRTLQIIRHLRALGFHVVLSALDNSTTEVDLYELQSSGIEVHKDHSVFLETLESRKDRIVAIWTIREEVYDFFGPRIKPFASNAKFITDLMDLKYNKDFDRNSGILRNQIRIANNAEQIVLVSDTEAKQLNNEVKRNNVKVVWAEYEPQRSEIQWDNSNGLLFVGGFRHLPNLIGIEWFANEVIPLLEKLGFQAPIRVVGSGLDQEKIVELEGKGLQILGPQENLHSAYLQSRIAIIPLLTGAGRKGKLGEALSYGIPIVSTTIGVEGFDSIEKSGVFVTDSPSHMAEEIFRLHQSKERWSALSGLGKTYCMEYLSSSAMRQQISSIVSIELANDI
jgi:GT2 family glycosyltransferase